MLDGRNGGRQANELLDLFASRQRDLAKAPPNAVIVDGERVVGQFEGKLNETANCEGQRPLLAGQAWPNERADIGFVGSVIIQTYKFFLAPGDG